MVSPYNLSVIQPRIRCVFDRDGQFHPNILQDNLERHCETIRATAKHYGSKIFVLPEFTLHGFAGGIPIEAWIEASCRVPGPETDAMGQVAKDVGAYIAFMIYEYMPDWPQRYWNTAVIVGPNGEVQHKYHKLYSQTTKTRPGDVHSEYISRMGGPEALFPVLDTPYGKLGTLICYDINFPEVTRCLALRGAEIFLYLTADGRSPWRRPDGGWSVARRARAYENVAYLAMANIGPIEGIGMPEDVSNGLSQVIDFDGQIMNVADTSNETVLTCEIDIEALRRRRVRPYMDPHASSMNFLAELNTQVHAPLYASHTLWPADHWAHSPIREGGENHQVINDVISRRIKEGRLVPPE